jgi:hypothetical protein
LLAHGYLERRVLCCSAPPQRNSHRRFQAGLPVPGRCPYSPRQPYLDRFAVVRKQCVMGHESADDSLTFAVSHYSIRQTARG